MVLQQGCSIPIFGEAFPSAEVSVEYAGQQKITRALPSGRWRVELDSLPATSVSRSLTIKTRHETVVFQDVVVGEVWLCAGQSNMEMALRAIASSGELARADIPNIRYLNVTAHQRLAGVPMDDVLADPWVRCTPQTAGNCTAVGYYFALRIQCELGVPIGLLFSAWGGTNIEPWTPLTAFQAFPDLRKIYDDATDEINNYQLKLPKQLNAWESWIAATRQALISGTAAPPSPGCLVHPLEVSTTKPSGIYNAMIHPLATYPIRGAVWYQGENNGQDGINYLNKMRALIKGWRDVWGKRFSFYFVQLASYQDPTDDPSGGDGWSRVRDAQFKALSIPQTGMAVAIDIGETNNIHPKNKREVGERLARWALANDYGQTNLMVSGPLYRGYKTEDNKIRIYFNHIGRGLIVGQRGKDGLVYEIPNGKLQRFAIAGISRKWVWADAIIAPMDQNSQQEDTILISSPLVPNPIAVRYAFSMNPSGANLYNRDGLPASPFRSDDW